MSKQIPRKPFGWAQDKFNRLTRILEWIRDQGAERIQETEYRRQNTGDRRIGDKRYVIGIPAAVLRRQKAGTWGDGSS